MLPFWKCFNSPTITINNPISARIWEYYLSFDSVQAAPPNRFYRFLCEYTRVPVRCSTNWAMKPHIGSEVNLLSSYLPVRSEMMWSLYEIIHIWTAVVDESEEWSSQLRRSRVRIPLKPWFFQASSFQLLKLENLTAMIILHFHLQPQFIYELFHINSTS